MFFFLPMRANAQLQYSDWETFSSNKQCQPQLRTDSRWAELSYVAIQTIKQQTLQKLQKRWLQSHMVAQKQANCTFEREAVCMFSYGRNLPRASDLKIKWYILFLSFFLCYLVGAEVAKEQWRIPIVGPNWFKRHTHLAPFDLRASYTVSVHWESSNADRSELCG